MKAVPPSGTAVAASAAYLHDAQMPLRPTPSLDVPNDADDASGDRAKLQTLIRGLSVLDALAAAPSDQGLTHASLARQLNLQRSTLYRYLAALQEMDFVEASEDGHRYRLGPRVLVLAAARGERGFARYAKDFVNEVAEATGETAHATIYSQGYSLTVETADGIGPIGPRIRIGSRRPAHASASGKVFLAWQPPTLLNAYLSRNLEGRTATTIVDRDALRAHIEDVRLVGYALDQGEYYDGISCIAAPVFDFRGRVSGSLSISVAVDRLDATRIKTLAAPLLRTTRKFSQELGYGSRGRAGSAGP
jgi:IclR family KDG regulon transcriptional repressor